MKQPKGLKSKGGRPKRRDSLPRELALKMVRQHDLMGSSLNLFFPRMIFGERIVAEDLMRRYKEKCQEVGAKYYREDAIGEAARLVGMNADQLANWVNRSEKSKRAK